MSAVLSLKAGPPGKTHDAELPSFMHFVHWPGIIVGALHAYECGKALEFAYDMFAQLMLVLHTNSMSVLCMHLPTVAEAFIVLQCEDCCLISLGYDVVFRLHGCVLMGSTSFWQPVPRSTSHFSSCLA